MGKTLKEIPKDLKDQIRDLVLKHPAIRVRQPANHKTVVGLSIHFEPIPDEVEVILQVEKNRDIKLVKSDEPFEEEHFEALLELPLSGLDREFVEFFQKSGNKPMTPIQWTTLGFAEKGRMDSINKMCKMHGLYIRFSTNGKRHSEMWPDYEHQFYVMKEREGSGQK